MPSWDEIRTDDASSVASRGATTADRWVRRTAPGSVARMAKRREEPWEMKTASSLVVSTDETMVGVSGSCSVCPWVGRKDDRWAVSRAATSVVPTEDRLDGTTVAWLDVTMVEWSVSWTAASTEVPMAERRALSWVARWVVATVDSSVADLDDQTAGCWEDKKVTTPAAS